MVCTGSDSEVTGSCQRSISMGKLFSVSTSPVIESRRKVGYFLHTIYDHWFLRDLDNWAFIVSVFSFNVFILNSF